MIYLTRTKRHVPPRGEGIRLAIYQGERPVGTAQAVRSNLDRLEEVVADARRYDAQLISFPELYVTGYALGPDLVKELAEPVDGPSIARVSEIAKANRMAIICPFPERAERAGEVRYYDSIALIDSTGVARMNYRKTHLFGRAERNNYSFGDGPFEVVDVEEFPVGILNCYEAEFPELSRILALKGARLVVIPTAADYYYTLADGTEAKVPYPDISRNLIPAHAYESHIFIAYSNRCGWEKLAGHQWHYRNNSVVAGPHGELLLAAGAQETLLIADVVPGDFGPTHPEGDYLKDRRPELYGDLVARRVPFAGGHAYPDVPE